MTMLECCDVASSVSLSQSLYEVVEGNTLDVMILANKTVPDGLGLALTLYQENVIVHGMLKMHVLHFFVLIFTFIPRSSPPPYRTIKCQWLDYYSNCTCHDSL